MSLAPNSRFMNELRRDLPDPAGGLLAVATLRQLEEALHERHRQRVRALAGRVRAPGSAALSTLSLTVMYGGLPTTTS